MSISQPGIKRKAHAIDVSAEESELIESDSDHRRDDMVKVRGDTSKSFPWAAPTLKLAVVDPDGGILANLQIPANTTPAELTAMLSTGSQLGIPRALLQLVAPCGHILQPYDLALADLDLQDGDHITCTQLQVPLQWDVIGQCDGCGYRRHLFYGYARQNPLADLEPVIALCHACGGAPQNRDEIDDDMRHA